MCACSCVVDECLLILRACDVEVYHQLHSTVYKAPSVDPLFQFQVVTLIDIKMTSGIAVMALVALTVVSGELILRQK